MSTRTNASLLALAASALSSGCTKSTCADNPAGIELDVAVADSALASSIRSMSVEIVFGMERAANGPFQCRDVAEIGNRCCRRERAGEALRATS